MRSAQRRDRRNLRGRVRGPELPEEAGDDECGLLASSGGRVLEREEIYSRLWGYAMVRGDRSVDVFVRKLRQKLERVSPGWRYIHTHFGIGYRFGAEPLDGARAPLAPVLASEPSDELDLARA